MKRNLIKVSYSLSSTQVKTIEGSSISTIFIGEIPFLLVNQKGKHTMVSVDRISSIVSDKSVKYDLTEDSETGMHG